MVWHATHPTAQEDSAAEQAVGGHEIKWALVYADVLSPWLASLLAGCFRWTRLCWQRCRPFGADFMTATVIAFTTTCAIAAVAEKEQVVYFCAKPKLSSHRLLVVKPPHRLSPSDIPSFTVLWSVAVSCVYLRLSLLPSADTCARCVVKAARWTATSCCVASGGPSLLNVHWCASNFLMAQFLCWLWRPVSRWRTDAFHINSAITHKA